MFLILERHKRDIFYKGEYLIYVRDVDSIPLFIEKLLKRNRIKIKKDAIDVSDLKKDFEGVHKLRKEKHNGR